VQAETFTLDNSAKKDSVYFRSPAKLEFIEGKTADISGSFTFDPARADSAVSGILQVDLRTLKTGIETRDGHMCERHLHTDKYPHAYFELLSIDSLPTTWQPDQSYKMIAEGFFYIHGVKRKISADILAVMPAGNPTASGKAINARISFKVKLDEFKIPRPKALFYKLAETIDVEAILFGYNSLAPITITLPNWPEQK